MFYILVDLTFACDFYCLQDIYHSLVRVFSSQVLSLNFFWTPQSLLL